MSSIIQDDRSIFICFLPDVENKKKMTINNLVPLQICGVCGEVGIKGLEKSVTEAHSWDIKVRSGIEDVSSTVAQDAKSEDLIATS